MFFPSSMTHERECLFFRRPLPSFSLCASDFVKETHAYIIIDSTHLILYRHLYNELSEGFSPARRRKHPARYIARGRSASPRVLHVAGKLQMLLKNDLAISKNSSRILSEP